MRTGRLIIVRRQPFKRDRFRAYRIRIDGKTMGKVKFDSRLDLELPAGRHTVQATMDWTSTEPLSINISPGVDTIVSVQPTMGSILSTLQLFNPRGWLRLEQESGSDS